MALLVLATLLGASLQSAAGFGFALVLAPAALAVLDPDQAVTMLLALGAALNLLVLFAEGRERKVRGREASLLVAWALPGLAVGALILAALSRGSLQVAVGLLVVVAAAVQARRRSRSSSSPVEPPQAGLRAAAGFTTGVLATSTGTSGPPLVLWFERIGATPAEMRDSLGATFLLLNGFGVLALLAPGGADLSLEPADTAILLAVTIAGQLLGRAAFVRLDPDRFRATGLVLILLTGLASIVAGLSG